MANCPNISFKTDPTQEKSDWNILVDKVGELEAYFIFSKNGYEMPIIDADGNYTLTDGSEASFDMTIESEKETEFFRKISKTRNRILNSLRTKYNIYEGSKKDESVKKLKELIEDFQKADITKSILIYIQNIDAHLGSEKIVKGRKVFVKGSLIEKMESSGFKKSPGNLKRLRDYAGTFEMVKDLVSAIESRDDIPQSFKARLASAAGKVDSFNAKYVEYSKDVMVDILANESTLVRDRSKEKYAREFRISSPRSSTKLTVKEYAKEVKAYVKKAMSDNAKQILRDEKKMLRSLLDVSPKDISAFSRQLIDPRGVNEHLVQLTVKMLDRAEKSTQREFIDNRVDIIDDWKEFKKGFGKVVTPTNQKKLYEDIIEKIDGKETSYYVREYYSTYYTAKNKLNNELMQVETADERRKLRQTFEKDFPRLKNLNPQYKSLQADGRKKKMYEILIKFNKDSDNNVPPQAKLGFKLPGISKELTETFTDEGAKKAAGRAWKELRRVQKDESDKFGELTQDGKGVKVVTDESGKVLKRVNIPFRSKLESEDQSFDLVGMALTNRFVSLNYKNKTAIKTQIEVLSDLVADRDVVKNKQGKKVLSKIKDLAGVELDEEQEVLEKGINSQAFILMEGVVEDRLYGRKMVKSDLKILGMDVDSLTDGLIGWSANNMLIANYMGGGANLLAGKVMNWFEGVRGQHYKRKDLRTAELKYMGDFTNWSADIGRVGYPTSKTQMLIEKFVDTSMDFTGMSNKLTKDSRFKQMAGIQSLHAINHAAEHYIHGTVVYAFLNNTKIVNTKGEFIGKDGNVVGNREDAMSLDEAYMDPKDEGATKGKLTLKNKNWRTEGYETSTIEENEFIVSMKLKEVVKDLHGNYDENNKAQIQRHWHGKLLFYLKKWMLPGVQRRWRGGEYLFKDLDSNLEDRAMYSQFSEEFKEGTYVSGIRYLAKLWKHGKFMQTEIYSQEWNKLTDTEKANIKSAVAELLTAVTSLVGALLTIKAVDGAEDEEEERRLYALAYLLRRQYSELAMYTPVGAFGEGLRLVSDPSAVMSTLSLIHRSFVQIFEDGFNLSPERYERGQFKGDSKTYVNLQKLFNPFFKQFVAKDIKQSYGFLVNTSTM